MRSHSTILPADLGLGREATPVRKMPGRTARTSWRAFSASHKIESEAMRFFESTLERDMHTLLSADPEIVRFAVQPHRLTYWCDEPGSWPVKRQYVPDVIAQTKSRRCLIFEAKSQTFSTKAPWSLREPFIRKAYREDHGLEMVVLTESQIRSQPRLSNCQILLQHRPFVADHETMLVLRRVLETTRLPSSIGAVLEAAAGQGVDAPQGYSVILQMIMSGELSFDHSKALSLDCQVSR